ncbi:MAG: helix-turn-helix domain-containing protein [Labilithrix sp.]|nr:helix-turn-helix domain-containing protein [Labilithrix sp.]MCW5810808.1 helix-turn-helix domain-containing protein [Labilithrix sp.]
MDLLAVLRRTEGRSDARSLVQRGVALAALDEWEDALALLERAQALFTSAGDRRAAARARLAALEVSVFRRDVAGAEEALAASARELAALGDHANAAWARVVAARLGILLGRGSEALRALEAIGANEDAPRTVRAIALLAAGEAALRFRRASLAADLFAAARSLADANRGALRSEIERALAALKEPIAIAIERGEETTIDVRALEALVTPAPMGGDRRVVVDALAGEVIGPGGERRSLRGRPALLALVVAFAQAHPRAVDWRTLGTSAMGAPRPNESHRARLKVELGRLRRVLPPGVALRSLGAGSWILDVPARVVTLVPLLPRGADERVLALLADGRAWRVIDLAEALGAGARATQRDLAALAARGLVRKTGRGPATRWHAPGRAESIASQMLLLGVDGAP